MANLRLGLTQQTARWKISEFVRVDNVADRSYVGSVIVMRGIEAAAAVLVLAFGVALLAGYMVTERMI